MKVIWSEMAREGRRQISRYIGERFGLNREKVFKQKVEQSVTMIMNYPRIGSLDPLFADRQEEYRSIVIDGLSKMVYRTDNDTLHIVAFWDCRQEPNEKVR